MPKEYKIIIHNCAQCPESLDVEYGDELVCMAFDPMRTCPEENIPDWCLLPEVKDEH